MYKLKVWADEIERLGKVPEITAEIGVARLTLQQLLTSCEQSANPAEHLLANQYQINTLINTITSAIEKWDRIKNRAANTLNKTQALTFVGEVLSTIKRYLPADELVKFNAEIENRMNTLFNEEDSDASS
jgi:chaperonin cofactor prefoldin